MYMETIVLIPTVKEVTDINKDTSFVGLLQAVFDDEINCKQLQGQLAYNPNEDDSGYYNICWQPMHLHVLSDDPIAIGDYFVNLSNLDDPINNIAKCETTACALNARRPNSNWKKIVKTTNQSIGLPIIPMEFINSFLEDQRYKLIQK